MTMIDVNTIDGVEIALVEADKPVISNFESATALLDTVLNNSKAEGIIICEAGVNDKFFNPDGKFALKIRDEFKRRGIKLCIYGNMNRFVGQPFHDFLYTANKEGSLYFAETQAEGINHITGKEIEA